ncbi:hypothetical protein BD779DRAFT_1543352 [Infundibulicybe gibba]|nr:hypothetical protein BD779DRAFT_1543352 [Infundibulicybe gibba]
MDLPPYQVQQLVSNVLDGSTNPRVAVSCMQALGSEIYVGCSNGELIRFALQVEDPAEPASYTILSRQSLPGGKPIDEITLVPCISRALILSDRQIHFYTLPSLDAVIPAIKPIRNVVTFAVDYMHLKRPPPSGPNVPLEPIEFCVIKRSAIMTYALREQLFLERYDIPLPQGASLARRINNIMCIADDTNYNIVDLKEPSMFPILPISQAVDPPSFVVKPSITIINENEFLILSWTGTNTLGLFISDQGDPVRGTLEWPSYPKALCLDYPHIATLLPNETVEVHNVETQTIVQVLPAPPTGQVESPQRLNLIASLNGYLVPSNQRTQKMAKVPVSLLRGFPLVVLGSDNEG